MVKETLSKNINSYLAFIHEPKKNQLTGCAYDHIRQYIKDVNKDEEAQMRYEQTIIYDQKQTIERLQKECKNKKEIISALTKKIKELQKKERI